MKTHFPCKNCILIVGCSNPCNFSVNLLGNLETYALRTGKCRLCGEKLKLEKPYNRNCGYRCSKCRFTLGYVFTTYTLGTFNLRFSLANYRDRLNNTKNEQWEILLLYRTPEKNWGLTTRGGNWRAVLINEEGQKMKLFYRADSGKDPRWIKA